MAKRKAKRAGKTGGRRWRLWRRLVLWASRLALVLVAVATLVIIAQRAVNPPRNLYMRQEAARLGGIDHAWVPLAEVAPVMARAVVAAEDANFCAHWGFDMAAIRDAIAEGGERGASTITQQTVKNVYLWPGRNWLRKALEAMLTPALEALWPKRRILEVYLNVAEFDEGVFGVEAAAWHYFRVGPGALSPDQAARLAAVLPSPKRRSAAKPSAALRRRAAAIRDGAATIARDGRAACFED